MRTIAFLALTFALTFGLDPAASAIETSLRLSLSTVARAEVSGDGLGGESRESEDSAVVSSTGNESSECQPYGRHSGASASAKATKLSVEDQSISVRLSVAAKANGGHYRKCLLKKFLDCPLGQCLALQGVDTKSKATAQAKSILKISFDPEFPPADYFIDIARESDSSALAIELKDGDGKALSLRSPTGGPQILNGGPGVTYFVSMVLPVEASDSGGCCSTEKSADATVTAGVRLQRAPILDSKRRVIPFIAGGAQTTGYPYVGAIKLGAALQCTGTLIGKATILTAAHCVYEFQASLQQGEGSFLLGNNVNQPSAGPFKIVGFDFPQDGTYRFEPKTLKDDVAVVYIEPADHPFVSLHTGVPSWPDLVHDQTSLVFVGFGYDAVGNQPVQQGVKREASWFMTRFDDKTVSFPAQNAGTCEGDSGGPAFLIDKGRIVQVAVTSGGYAIDCHQGGVESRVDAYLPWLAPRTR